MMHARPILFSAPMIRALLEGRKTQTRRVAKSKDVKGFSDLQKAKSVSEIEPGVWQFCSVGARGFNPDEQTRAWAAGVPCPYGKPGDLLWVRETFGWHDIFKEYVYRATDEPDRMKKWKPSIFMPRSASRLTLEITGVRVERLQEISREDALAEGIEYPHGAYSPPLKIRANFARLWKTLHGADSWSANPWVWAIEFKVHLDNVDKMIERRTHKAQEQKE